jgi:SAM-dependent methyltransferase
MTVLLIGLALIVLFTALLWLLVPAFYGLPPLAARPERIRKALQLADLASGERFYDLGAGHGGVVVIAAREFGANAVGLEAGPVQCAIARVNAIRNGIHSRVRIVMGNFFRADLKDADVVYAYLTSQYAVRLQEKLERELKSGARVVTVSFDLPGWEPALFDREDLIFVYRK